MRPCWLEITHADTYMRTPALRVAIKAWLEIEQSGHGDGEQLISWNHPAFIAWDERDKKVCGILTYRPKSDDHVIHIQIGYIEPSYRRLGIYSLLWHALCEQAKKLEAKQITGIMHSENTAMRTLAAKLGRQERPLVQCDYFLN